jgi:molybdenum cofactor cytidylyltransferase
MNHPCAIVLGAGFGRRYAQATGTDKLMAPCVGLDGIERPVLEQALLAFQDWAGERLLVVRKESQALQSLGARYGFEVELITTAGMGDSLSAAVRARPHACGWLVALGDMPWVQPSTLAKVAAAMAPDRACVPTYVGQWGHPVGFGARYGTALTALSGDQGGRRLLHEGPVYQVGVEDSGILRDVDLPEDLIRA